MSYEPRKTAARRGGVVAAFEDFEHDLEPVARQAGAQPLRPLDHRRALGQRLVQAQLERLLGRGQPVEVEVGDREGPVPS